MSSLNKVLIFTAGVAIGVAASWKFFENKYKKIAQEEIDSVKEVFSRREKERAESTEEASEDTEPEITEEDRKDYSNLVRDLGYTNEEKGGVTVKKPYIIPPDEFGEHPNYGAESLTYYADGVLTDDFDNPIENVEAMVGNGFESHFGEYEDDSVFIRNEDHKTDYEILRDERNFSDIPKRTPYTVYDDEA